MTHNKSTKTSPPHLGFGELWLEILAKSDDFRGIEFSMIFNSQPHITHNQALTWKALHEHTSHGAKYIF